VHPLGFAKQAKELLTVSAQFILVVLFGSYPLLKQVLISVLKADNAGTTA
jgi:hypothetical protein